ncbi:MAG: growth inhibitor PemK [Pseudomonadota bacterium]|nr:growth inhibitor PemK [Pseudomonadota bacterium]
MAIRYVYLWRGEALAGRDEGMKDRPCVIVLAVENRDGARLDTVAPITHDSPRMLSAAIELPPAVKRRLGLDGAASWIVATEVNQFVWPGPDLRPARRGEWAYGFIPGALLRRVRERMAAGHRLSLTRRTDR